MTEHDVTLHLNADWDIELWCTCNWKANLGISPSMDRAMENTFDHYRGAKVHAEMVDEQFAQGAKVLKAMKEGMRKAGLID